MTQLALANAFHFAISLVQQIQEINTSNGMKQVALVSVLQ
jgi:hypothetical protein